MKTMCGTTFLAANLTFLALTTCKTSFSQEPDQEAAVVLRYRLPIQSELMGESSAAPWGLAAPVIKEISNPTRIVYDEALIQCFAKWAVDAPIRCGAGSYAIETGDGVTTVSTGLDESYLGRRFRAEDLVLFLKNRIRAKTVERSVKITDPNVIKFLGEHPNSTAAKRLKESPWDRDTRTVVSLLSLARYKPAYPLLKELVKDPSESVRYFTVIGLGRIAPSVPQAVDDLVELLSNKELRSVAFDGLAIAGKTVTGDSVDDESSER